MRSADRFTWWWLDAGRAAVETTTATRREEPTVRSAITRGTFTWVLAVGLFLVLPIELPTSDDVPALEDREIAVDDWLDADVRTATAAPGHSEPWTTSEPIPASDAALVGASWPPDATVRVELRVAKDGGWSDWMEVVMGAGEGPDPESDEGMAADWTVSDPTWIGHADHLQVRVAGAGPEPEISLHTVDVPRDRGHVPAELRPDTRPTARASTQGPSIIPRSSWDPNGECEPRRAPNYTETVDLAVIHHTASHADYEVEESADIVLATCRYHTHTRGWNHIGYNIVVDRFGNVFEGRDGGVDRPVVGAHAAGFNTGSIGISTIGCFDQSGCSTRTSVWRDMLDAVDEVLAWRFHLHGIDPQGEVTVTSRGSTRYASGQEVTLPTIIGHRDVTHTACPGDQYYRYVHGDPDDAFGEVMGDRVAERMTSRHQLPRIAGIDRIGTATALSQWGYHRADRVIIASSEQFPDGLAAGALAGALEGPVLLSRQTGLTDAVIAEIDRLGAREVLIVGGHNALSSSIEHQLVSQAGIDPERIDRLAGANRWETAAAIAAEVIDRERPDAAIIALGHHSNPASAFPDALSASALGATYGLPVLLVGPDHLPDPTRAILDGTYTRDDGTDEEEPNGDDAGGDGSDDATGDSEGEDGDGGPDDDSADEEHEVRWSDGIYVVGGSAAISDRVVAQIRATVDPNVEIHRLADDDRYGTSREVLEAWRELGDREAKVLLFATGRDWPDALTAGAAAAGRGAGLLLVDGHDLARSGSSRHWVESHVGEISEGWGVGGDTAVRLQVTEELRTLLR